MAVPRRGKKLPFGSLEEMAAFIKDSGEVEMLDACFADPLGCWHHCSFAKPQCQVKDLAEGFYFDGSSIPLYTTIEKSDMKMVPDPSTCWLDPFYERKTLHVVCNIQDPDGNSFERCPRGVAMRAERYMRSENLADTVYVGPEPEFFIFDNVRYSVETNKGMFEVDGLEGCWQSGVEKKEGNLAHRGIRKSYYFPVSPQDTGMNIRNDMLLTMGEVGLPIEKHHHEAGTCQHELGFTCSDLVTTADNVMTYKYIVKNVALLYGKTATFMPKPMAGEAGSGMHCHQSLWKDDRNLFFDANGSYCKLSQMALYYIGGILHHAPAMSAFTNPTVNSYKRLVPGFEAPASLLFSEGNRSAAIRIPLSGMDDPGAKRIEYRCPDAACCPYIAFSVILMAGLDGIKKKIVPPAPLDKDLYNLSLEERSKIQLTPASLDAAINALEADHEFLTIGSVFSESFIKSYIALKRNEIKTIAGIPTPKDYELYYHC